ncbi:MIER3 isoform 11, partial [Pan troglodytes]
PTIPAVANSSANSSPSELADELPDMTLDKISGRERNPHLGTSS